MVSFYIISMTVEYLELILERLAGVNLQPPSIDEYCRFFSPVFRQFEGGQRY